MKLSQSDVDAVNRERTARDPDQDHIDAFWRVDYEGRCLSHACVATHRFVTALAITSHEGREYPRPRIMIEQDDHYFEVIPLTKAALAEFITDAQACLDALP